MIHFGSTSVIARPQLSSPGLDQQVALSVWLLQGIRASQRSAEITWAKGQGGMPGNERADVLAGVVAERQEASTITSIAHLKLKISGRFRAKKVLECFLENMIMPQYVYSVVG